MKELGVVLGGCVAFYCFFAFIIYPDLEYKGYPSTHSCTGECYEEYVRVNGTTVEILKAKQALAAGDPFSSIRGLWAGCAACHGVEGQGQGMFPTLAGQSSDYILSRLTAYKNREQVGMNSSMMWGQAAMLSDKDIQTISDYIGEGLPSE